MSPLYSRDDAGQLLIRQDAHLLALVRRAYPGTRLVIVERDPRDAFLNWLAAESAFRSVSLMKLRALRVRSVVWTGINLFALGILSQSTAAENKNSPPAKAKTAATAA